MTQKKDKIVKVKNPDRIGKTKKVGIITTHQPSIWYLEALDAIAQMEKVKIGVIVDRVVKAAPNINGTLPTAYLSNLRTGRVRVQPEQQYYVSHTYSVRRNFLLKGETPIFGSSEELFQGESILIQQLKRTIETHAIWFNTNKDTLLTQKSVREMPVIIDIKNQEHQVYVPTGKMDDFAKKYNKADFLKTLSTVIPGANDEPYICFDIPFGDLFGATRVIGNAVFVKDIAGIKESKNVYVVITKAGEYHYCRLEPHHSSGTLLSQDVSSKKLQHIAYREIEVIYRFVSYLLLDPDTSGITSQLAELKRRVEDKE